MRFSNNFTLGKEKVRIPSCGMATKSGAAAIYGIRVYAKCSPDPIEDPLWSKYIIFGGPRCTQSKTGRNSLLAQPSIPMQRCYVSAASLMQGTNKRQSKALPSTTRCPFMCFWEYVIQSHKLSTYRLLIHWLICTTVFPPFDLILLGLFDNELFFAG